MINVMNTSQGQSYHYQSPVNAAGAFEEVEVKPGLNTDMPDWLIPHDGFSSACKGGHLSCKEWERAQNAAEPTPEPSAPKTEPKANPKRK